MNARSGWGEIYARDPTAVRLGLFLAGSYDRQTPVLLFVGNRDAAPALISGSGGSEVSNRIIAAFYLISASAGINVCFEYAPSKLHIADAHSRPCHVSRNDNEIAEMYKFTPSPTEYFRGGRIFRLPQAAYGYKDSMRFDISPEHRHYKRAR